MRVDVRRSWSRSMRIVHLYGQRDQHRGKGIAGDPVRRGVGGRGHRGDQRLVGALTVVQQQPSQCARRSRQHHIVDGHVELFADRFDIGKRQGRAGESPSRRELVVEEGQRRLEVSGQFRIPVTLPRPAVQPVGAPHSGPHRRRQGPDPRQVVPCRESQDLRGRRRGGVCGEVVLRRFVVRTNPSTRAKRLADATPSART